MPKWAVRDGNYKLVHMGKDATPELFDLSKDVGEQKDLASENPELVKKLQAEYQQWSSQLETPRWKDSRQAKPGGKKKNGKAAAAAVDDDDDA